jgi:carboxylesterase
MMKPALTQRRSRVPILAGAEPFAVDGDGPAGRTGVLVSHGFTGTPQSMRPWAEHLAAQGYSVRLPLLPGHGTTWQEMNRTTWNDWYAEVRAGYLAWAVRSRPGIGSDIKKPGMAELSYDRTPLRAFVSMQAAWRSVIADLGKITVPILYFHSAEDHVVDALSAKLLHAGATSTTVREVSLDNSYHVATVDHDAETIFTGSVEFIAQHTRTGV